MSLYDLPKEMLIKLIITFKKEYEKEMEIKDKIIKDMLLISDKLELLKCDEKKCLNYKVQNSSNEKHNIEVFSCDNCRKKHYCLLHFENFVKVLDKEFGYIFYYCEECVEDLEKIVERI